MYYYAYINDSNICQGTYGFPSQISDTHYIYLGTTDDQSVIGKRWNANTQQWEEVTNFYYAQLDGNDICIGVVEYPSEVISDQLIRITSLDDALIGMWYDRTDNTFKVAPFHIIADHSTDVVNYRSTDLCLSDVLDSKAVAADVYTKSEVDNMISNIGGAGTDGVDGQDGTTVVVGTTTTGDAGTNAAVVGVLDEETNTLTLNFTIPKGADGADGQDGTGADVTANDILTKLKTVDGQNSGLDADLLDGHNADYFATATQLAGKADSEHTHTGYATTTQLANKADSDHTHTGYAATGHTHSEYAAASHSHSGYASSGHTHSDYFEKAGGTISGETNFSGGLVRLKGVQTLFHSGNQLVFGSNSLPTRIAGNAISATKTITVDSDERLKENIVAANADKMVEFIENVKVVNFNYKADESKAVVLGAVAQQLCEAQPDIAKYLVEQGADGYYSVKIADLVFPLIAAVQKLSREVKELQGK